MRRSSRTTSVTDIAPDRESFIVFSPNAFAILSLRSLYFLLGGMQGKFRYLNVGLGVILGFVGIKMLIVGPPLGVHLPTYVSLTVIAVVLAASFLASLRADRRDPPDEDTRPLSAIGDRDRGSGQIRSPVLASET